ncbi:MAG: hypothetical protein HRU41_01170 [Saprospiraceae bacterium]|nr:hypothetical protein [Saprospiraceae bacterium]
MKYQLTQPFSISLLLILSISLSMCRTEASQEEPAQTVDISKFKQRDNVVRVRMPIDPRTFNPILYTDSQSRMVFEYMFPYLMTYDAQSLEPIPQLAVAKPEISEIESGPNAGNLAYTFILQEKANWDNGTPVTGHDMAFTLKAMFNPLVPAAHLRSYFDFIAGVEVDEANPKRFTITTQKPYMLQELGLSSLPVMPAYLYDPDGLMADIPLEDLTNVEKAQQLAESDQDLKAFADAFTSPLHNLEPEGVAGPGPYKLVSFETGQGTELALKENWWGKGMEEAFPSLSAYPEKIIFQVVKDQNTTIAAIKDEALDVAGRLDSKAFAELEKDTDIQDIYALHKPSTFQFYFIGINTQSPLLSDKRTRRALAHLVDVEDVIETLYNGYAEAITGPFHPKKPIAHKGLDPIDYNLEKAKALLAEAGWEDANGDGVLDREIDGERVDFSITYLEYQASTFGSNMTLYLKEQAKRVGVDVNINSVDRGVMIQDLANRNFDLYGGALSPGHEPEEDPKAIWHTESDHPRGLNRMRFSHPRVDELIDELRLTTDEQERKKLFLELQEIIYDEQPAIFLFAPLERLAFHRRFEAQASSIRPGYRLGAFQLMEDLVVQ